MSLLLKNYGMRTNCIERNVILVDISNVKLQTLCPYCGSFSVRDERGNCVCCGAPKSTDVDWYRDMMQRVWPNARWGGAQNVSTGPDDVWICST